MRKTFCTFLVVLLTLSFTNSQEARAEMPVKARAFMTILGYGTAGGALVGAASTAFGNSTRAIAQGASLGLYAGIIFGTYVLVSHHNRQYRNYDDNSSPYKDSNDIYSDEYQSDAGGSGDNDGDSRSGFFDRFQTLQEKFHGQSFSLGQKEKGSKMPPFSVNLVQFSF